MSNSSGKETYVVIFRRSLAECSNRCGVGLAGEQGERKEEGQGEGEGKGKGEGTCLENHQPSFHSREHNIAGLQRERRLSASRIYTLMTR